MCVYLVHVRYSGKINQINKSFINIQSTQVTLLLLITLENKFTTHIRKSEKIDIKKRTIYTFMKKVKVQIINNESMN